MAVYTTRIEAAREEAPILLGNGNPVLPGDSPRRAPFRGLGRSASQAFLSVRAGGRGKSRQRLARLRDEERGARSGWRFTWKAASKRARINALDALERSMRWDEDVFGREYDLDVFNIVAVSDFNMGAMGNKGPQHLQRQICPRLARNRDGCRLRPYRGDHRA